MTPPKRPIVLSIAGLDPSGGAGLIADLETLFAFGARPMGVATALTGQSSTGVSASSPVDPQTLSSQLAPLLQDFPIQAIKIGMLGTAQNISCVASLLQRYRKALPVVLDPVILSSSGFSLLEEAGKEALRRQLLPQVTLLTPNLDELWGLSGVVSRVEEAVDVLFQDGAKAILVKGGHAEGQEAQDILCKRGEPKKTTFTAPRIGLPPGLTTARGTGCRLSSGIAARLAHGDTLEEAIQASKEHLTGLLQKGISRLGKGPAGYF